MGNKSTRKLWAAHIARAGHKAEPRGTDSVTLGKQFRGRVLGIDPSLRGSGFAVLDYGDGNSVQIIESATLKLHRKLSMPECLGAIGNQVDDFLPMMLSNNKFQAAHDHKEPDQKLKDFLVNMPHNKRRDHGAEHGKDHELSTEPQRCEIDDL